MPSRTQISGAAFPLVIDQADITAPGFPRSQEWWTRFIPQWITVEVQPAGTVTLDYNGRSVVETEPPKLTAAQLRRGRANMVRCPTLRALARHLAPEALEPGNG